MADLRALVVDDEPLARDELCFMLGEVGATVVVGQAGESSQALALLEELEPDAVFVDLRMPGPDGLALAEAIMARRPGTPVVVVSAHDEGALRAFEVGVTDYLLKPARLDRVKKAIERVRERLGDTLDDAELSDQGGDSDAPLRRLPGPAGQCRSGRQAGLGERRSPVALGRRHRHRMESLFQAGAPVGHSDPGPDDALV